jgi:hypothetical protein
LRPSSTACAYNPPAGPAPPASLSSFFRLNIVGLDCTRVSKIDSFTVKQHLAGGTLDMAHYQVDQIRTAAANLVEFPNLRIELATAFAETWRTWFKSFVIDGNSSAMNEKTGTLSFLAPNLSTVLATIGFQISEFSGSRMPRQTKRALLRSSIVSGWNWQSDRR